MSFPIRNRREWEALVKERFGMHLDDSPCYWPVERIKKAIVREFPRFRRSRVKVLARSHNLVVSVSPPPATDHRLPTTDQNKSYIFKFCWHPRSNLKKEISILRLLGGKTKTPIPNPLFIGRNARFFGYEKIPGRILQPGMVRSWGLKKKGELAQSLAELCLEVQKAIPARLRGGILGRRVLPTERAVNRVEKEFKTVFAGHSRLVAAAGAVFENYRDRLTLLESAYTPRESGAFVRTEPSSVGFDLQLENLLVDSQGRLTGALDFGYLTWSDPSGLFGLLHKDDPALARLTMDSYGFLSGAEMSEYQAGCEGNYAVFSYLLELSTNRWDMGGRRKEYLRIASRIAGG